MRIIDADKFAKLVKEFRNEAPNAETRKYICNVILSMLGDENQTPTISPDSLVKRGRWVNNKDEYPECSECKYMPQYDPHIDDIYYSPYCPNCGAKMDEGGALMED